MDIVGGKRGKSKLLKVKQCVDNNIEFWTFKAPTKFSNKKNYPSLYVYVASRCCLLHNPEKQ
jgi:hypothetical protein